MEIQISVASPDDAAELLEIYAPYIRESAVTFETDVPTVGQFRQRIEQTLEKYPYIKASSDGKILGYVYASEFDPRRGVDRRVKTSIYVSRSAHGAGIGRRLYGAFESALALQNITVLYACIAYAEDECELLTKNSVLFHEKMGYRPVWRFPKDGYKFDRWFDTLMMEKRIGERADKSAPVKLFPEVRAEFEQLMNE